MYEFTTAAFGLVVLISFVQEAETSAVLTADPQTSNVWSGETVHLTCKVEDSDTSTQREYSWKKLRETKETTLYSGTGEGSSTYTLRRVTESNSAQYWCEAKTKNGKIISSPHTLTVTSPPPAVLTLNLAWRKFYPTEKVTLKCEIQTRQTEWSYLWYRDGAPINSVDSSSVNEFTIPALDQSHNGRYSCRGRIPGRSVYTNVSNDVTLTVDALPPVVLTLQTGWTNIFNRERAALHCHIQDRSAVWMHKWYRDGQELPVGTDEDTYEILSAVQSDSGTYTCQGQHKERVLYTGISSTVALKVSAPPPAVLTLNPTWRKFYPTEKVTLKCEIQSRRTRWSYMWYRDGASMNSVPSKGNEYTIPVLKQSHSGRYSCIGRLPRRDVYTEMSKDETLTVDGEAPKPLLTLDPPSGEIFTGDTVTLSCRVGTDPAGWEYLWFKETQGAALTSTDSSSTDGSSYTIHPAAVSHGGQYWCRAGRGRPAFYTPYSDSLQLSITALPPAVLTLNPAWRKFYPTEKVTLKCEIQSRQTRWSYLWYRDGAPMKSALSRGNEYTIPALDQSHSGRYSCKGGIPGRDVYTEMSKDETLTVDGKAPKPLLTLDPPSGEIFTGDTVTLSCRVGTDPAGWEYIWYKETLGATLTSTDSSSTDGSSYTIHSAAVSHGGEYWCRAWRGKPAFYTLYSDSLQLSITARPQAVLTLETAWTEIFRSDSLTLRCQVEGSSAEWNYTWYRDGRHLPLDPSRDRLTLTAGNDSYSSEYKCRGNRTGQPSYTEISEGFRENNIVLKRKVLVSVASSLLLGLILTVLGCVCLRKKRKLAYKMTPQNDMFLSKPPTENLYGDVSNEEQSTEANAACSIELYSILDLKTKTEVLPPKQNPEDLTSFKAGQ